MVNLPLSSISHTIKRHCSTLLKLSFSIIPSEESITFLGRICLRSSNYRSIIKITFLNYFFAILKYNGVLNSLEVSCQCYRSNQFECIRILCRNLSSFSISPINKTITIVSCSCSGYACSILNLTIWSNCNRTHSFICRCC